jgi:hypothetical protein
VNGLSRSGAVHWFGAGIIGRWFAQHRRRGATVPFEAPALRMAQVCDDERDGMIAILHDFANNGSMYIVPWNNLPLMASMTTHDAVLHKGISESKATSPAQVRDVVCRLALSGALGPEAQARESERSRGDQTRLVEVELVLILHLLDRSGSDLAGLVADPARWRDRDAKAALNAAARAVAVRRRDIYRRISELARLLTPVGLVAADGAIQPGWLRVLHDEIEGFGEGVAVTDDADPPNVREYLASVAEAAKRAAQLSGIVLSMIDYTVLDIDATMRRWNTELPTLRQTIERLTALLDEWPSLMKWVHDAQRGPPDGLIRELRALHSVLPRLPSAEAPSASQESGDRTRMLSVSRVLGVRLAAIWSMLHRPHAVEH